MLVFNVYCRYHFFICSQTNVRMETLVCAKQMNGNANLSINVFPDHSTVMAKMIVKMGPMRLGVVSYSHLKNELHENVIKPIWIIPNKHKFNWYFLLDSPTIVVSPPKRIELEPFDTITINCTAMGIPTPEIVWRLNWGCVPQKCTMTSIEKVMSLKIIFFNANQSSLY